MAAAFVAKIAKKAWVVLVILAVVAVAGIADYRLHGVFASDRVYADGGAPLEEPRDLHPKHVRYEVYGPAGASVDINYMDEHANPQRATVASLPWSVEFTMTKETGGLNVIAQGDSNYLGCRIIVNGDVKDDYVAQVPYAHTYCQDRNE